VKRLLIILTALLPAAGVPPRASETPRAAPADLAALLAEAETSSPALRAAGARSEAAARLPGQAEAPPDPEVSLAYTNDGISSFTLGESEFSILALTWTQEVRRSGKRDRAREVAQREADRAALDRERVRREVAAAVKSAYAGLVRLDRTAAILDETRALLEEMAQASRRRYEAGQGIQESVLKAQAEVLRIEVEQARIAQDRRSAEIRLNEAVGRAADTPIGAALELPQGELPGDPGDLADAAVAASPEIAVMEASVRREEAGVELAKAEEKPDFVWSASYQNRGGLDPMVMGMFGVRLPLYRERKQAAAVLEKESEVTAAREDLSEARLRARSTVRDLVSRVQRADRLLALYSQGLIPQAREALESARVSYSVGRISLLDLLNDVTVLLNARTDVAAQETERVQALAALEPLLARDLLRAAAGAGDEGGRDAQLR
jgi:cobalt-zinc-cadmium efflux system outer membrane protein